MRKNHLAMVLGAAIPALLCVLVFPVTGFAAEFTADMIHTSPMGNFNGKAYVKGKAVRKEMSVGGRSQVMIFRGDKDLTWILMPKEKMYMEMGAGTLQGMVPSDPEKLGEKGKKEFLGKEKISGYICSKYRYTFEDPSVHQSTVWISEKLNFPVKIEVDSEQGKITVLYKNIREKRLPRSLFEVPKGYQKMSMPMMPGMKQ